MSENNTTPETDETSEVEVEETYELSEQDELDLRSLQEEDAPYHTLLHIWTDVLSHSEKEMHDRVEPSWAANITAQFPQIKVQEMVQYRDLYFSKINQLRDILAFEVATDDQALQRTTVETDRTENAHHYKNLLRDWQLMFRQWELDWDCTSPDAHIEIAAISNVHKMFFSQQGLVNHLDNIGFQFTEDDQEELTAALEEFNEQAKAGTRE